MRPESVFYFLSGFFSPVDFPSFGVLVTHLIVYDNNTGTGPRPTKALMKIQPTTKGFPPSRESRLARGGSGPGHDVKNSSHEYLRYAS